MSILPYPRHFNPEEIADSDIPVSLSMVETPYMLEQQTTPNDSSKYAVEDWYINPRYRYVQYSYTQDPAYLYPFSAESIDYISWQITTRLKGVHPEGKDIVVPDNVIRDVMDSVWNQGYNLIP